ncbi:MAG: signal peptidase I [Bacilli bacterium]
MKKEAIILCTILVGYFLCMNFIVIPYVPNLSTYIIKPLLWVLIAGFTYIFTKDKYVKIKDKNKVLQVCIIIILSYTIIYYLSGLYFGFIKTAYSRSLFSIFKNIYAFILIIILQEFVRYKILRYGNKNILLFIFVSIMFTTFEFNILTIMSSLTSGALIFEFIASKAIPSLCFNLFYSYLCCINNYKASIIFRVPVLLLSILIGIYPNLNWYIYGCIQIIFVACSYYTINHYISNNSSDIKLNKKYIIKKNRIKDYIAWCVFIIVIVTGIIFISGRMNYVPLAIMSNSMKPTFERGDTVIYKKVKDLSLLKKGDILVFGNDNKIICHRIKSISKNGKILSIVTKGDNLSSEDAFITTNEDIIGVSKYVIPYIGYPSVTLYELLK